MRHFSYARREFADTSCFVRINVITKTQKKKMIVDVYLFSLLHLFLMQAGIISSHGIVSSSRRYTHGPFTW